MTTIMNCERINDNELNNITGGSLSSCPGWRTIQGLGLDEYIKGVSSGWSDVYYDIQCSDGLHSIGSEDMLRYVAEKIGTSDPRYIALSTFAQRGYVEYNGEIYAKHSNYGW